MAGLLHHPGFLRLWAGDALSQLGTMVTGLAMPLLALRVLDATAFEVGLLTTFEYLAFLLVGLPAGVWVDRVRRRSVLVVADVGRAALLGSVPVAAVLGVLTLWQVYVVVLAVGVCTVFFDVAYQSYLPFLVGREHLVEGNAKLQGTQSVAQLAGPSLGGLLVQAITAPYAIAADALSFVWSAFWVGSIPRSEPRVLHRPERALRREVVEGLGFVFRHRLLRPIAACTATANFWNAADQAMVMVLLARVLDLSAAVIGLLMSAAALGGLLGAVLARRLATWVGQGVLLWVSMAVSGATFFVQPFLHRDWTLGVFAAAQVLLGLGVVVYNVTQVSFRQQLCPERLLGRMNATVRFVVWGAMPLGGLLGGALATGLGVRTTLLICAVGGSLAVAWVFFSPLRWMRHLPAEAAA